jgi:DNA repair exonuclease SbcCD ATPase subunit
VILKVQAENFRSFPFLSYEVLGNGLVAVEGYWYNDPTKSNGAGKSSFLSEVLTWAIFGETTEGQAGRGKVKDVVRGGVGTCQVTVELPFVKWTRSQKAGNKSNKLDIEGQEFHRLEDAKAYLLSLFPPKRVFTSTLVLGQGIGNRLSGWQPAERSRVFSKLFGLTIFEQALAQVRNIQGRWEKARAAAEGKLALIAQQKESLPTGEVTPEKIAHLQELLRVNEQSRVMHEKSKEKVDKKLADKQHERAQLSGKATTHQTTMAFYRGEMDKVKDSVCPTCGRKMPKTVSATAAADFQKKYDAEAAALTKLAGRLKKIEPAVLNYQQESAALASKLSEFHSLIQSQSSRLGAMESQAGAVAALRTQEQVALAEKEVADTEIGYYALLDKAFGPAGIPLRKMESALDALNIVLARICEQVWESEVFVQLSSERALKGGGSRAEIDVVVEGFDGPNYAACSPGERRRIDLTVQLALREVLLTAWGNRLPLLVCDDIVEVLDASAEVQLYENYLVPASASNAVFVVSPKPSLPSGVPRIYIYRTKEGARVGVNQAEKMIRVQEFAGG